MDIISENAARNYLPLDLETRLHCCRRRKESGWPIRKICSYYHVRRPSLFRWLRRYDGTPGSLEDGSHRPHSRCPFALSREVDYKIRCLFNKSRENGMSSVEIWVKLNSMAGLSASYSSVLRRLRSFEGYEPYRTNPKKRHGGFYDTPKEVGEKWQMDVKFVPPECRPAGGARFYQYTILDEASRKRFLYWCGEHSMWESVNALRAAVAFFGYAPKVLQTDNGSEFSDRAFTKDGSRYGRGYPNVLESYLASSGISHKFIRPRTPEHNGKVERSHRIDQEKFYRNMRFYSLDDLRSQGARWNRRYNEMPKLVLGLRTPNQAELESLRRLLQNTGEIRCPKRLTSLGN
jgi:transposase InsO family protein